MLSDAAEKTQEFIEKALDDSDNHVVHCPKCYGAQQSEKYMKAATFFSLGAFILSIVSIVLPFLHVSDISQDNWEKLLKVLDSIQVSSSSSSASAVLVPAKSSSSRAAQSAAARSSAVSSTVASSEASSSSQAAMGGASSSSSSDGGTGV